MDYSKLTEYLDGLCGTECGGLDISVCKDGKEIYRHMSGYADVEKGIKISEKTIYPLFSSTKVITVTAALMLYEQGKFGLDDELFKYIPEFKDMQILGEDGVVQKAKSPIIIRHLFSMMAGFSYDLDTKPLRDFNDETDGKCPTAFLGKHLCKEPLRFEPGEGWCYSLCHDVLGLLIEKVSNMTFGEFLSEKIFSPLGMRDTHFAVPKEKSIYIAERYAYNDETNRLEHFPNDLQYRFGTEYESGGAGLYSTVNDYMKFLNALISGKLISKETIDLMRTNCIPDELLHLFQPGGCEGCGFGLGVKVVLDPEINETKVSRNAFGWGGATGTHVVIDPSEHLTIFYAKNVSSLDQKVTKRVENLVYEVLRRDL